MWPVKDRRISLNLFFFLILVIGLLSVSCIFYFRPFWTLPWFVPAAIVSFLTFRGVWMKMRLKYSMQHLPGRNSTPGSDASLNHENTGDRYIYDGLQCVRNGR